MSAVPTSAPQALPLRDIHLPPPPSWWPPAPGWWLLAAIAVIIAWGLLRLLRRRLRARRWRAQVRAQFERIVAAHAEPDAAIELAAAISQLLRRVSLLLDPAAAALQGEVWLAFLDRQFPPAEAQRGPFRHGAGRALLELPYRAADARAPEQARALLELARRWLDHVLDTRPAHV
ncbi:MAG: DUF4381 domain-containing protein [Dokdonella sp.]|nr:MAG: DUF4381 domain-containing protein [Dokdonella sp.]